MCGATSTTHVLYYMQVGLKLFHSVYARDQIHEHSGRTNWKKAFADLTPEERTGERRTKSEPLLNSFFHGLTA